MAKYRDDLPQLSGDLFLTDGGIETTLIFHDGFELPEFAAFDLLKQSDGREALRKYFRTYAALAREHEVGFVFESATWRASQTWGQKLGYSDKTLARMNQEAIELLQDIRHEYETGKSKMVISGCIGPRGDGYDGTQTMTAAEAASYHTTQIAAFRDTGADMVTALTMTNVQEAIGITRAARSAAMPVAISPSVAILALWINCSSCSCSSASSLRRRVTSMKVTSPPRSSPSGPWITLQLTYSSSCSPFLLAQNSSPSPAWSSRVCSSAARRSLSRSSDMVPTTSSGE